MGTKAVRVLRDRKRDFPQAANVRVKAIRRLFRWALDDEIPGVKNNPARDVSCLRGRQGGLADHLCKCDGGSRVPRE